MFKAATKEHAKLRLAIHGPPGAGKTYTALAIGTSLGARVAVIDSEKGSAAKYADKFRFDTCVVEDNFAPQRLIDALEEIAKEKYDVAIIDSASLFWNGPGGFLEMVDDVAKRAASRNGGKVDTHGAWREVDKEYRRFVQAILRVPAHVIVTLRAKTEYARGGDDGKGKLQKLGLAPEMRDAFQYEMDVEGMLDMNHDLMIGKTRCDLVDGKTFKRPGADLAKILLGWVQDGVAPAPRAPESAPAAASAAAAANPLPDRSGELLAMIAAAHTVEALAAAGAETVKAIRARQISKVQYDAIVAMGLTRKADLLAAEVPENPFGVSPSGAPAVAAGAETVKASPAPEEPSRDPTVPDTGDVPHAKSDEAPLPPTPPPSTVVSTSAAAEPEPPPSKPSFTPETSASAAPAPERDIDDEDCRLRARILNLDTATELERSAVVRDVEAWATDPAVPENFRTSIRGFLTLNTRKLPEVAKPMPVGRSMKGAA